MTKTFAILLLVLSASALFAQTKFPGDPDSAILLTQDIDRFWKAFDAFKKDTKVNPFQKDYLDVGSAGVQSFIPDRIGSADNIP